MLKLFRIVALALVLCSLFAFTLPMIGAQEATTEPAAEATAVVEGEAESVAAASEGEIAEPSSSFPGAGTFILFIGAGAIVIVGLLMIARDNFTGDTE